MDVTGKSQRPSRLPPGLPFENYANELSALEQLSTPVSVSVLSTIVSAYAAARKHAEIVSRVQALVPRMRGAVGSYGRLFTALQSVAGSVDLAFAVMQQAVRAAREKENVPDARTYHCLIGVCAKQGDFEDAMRAKRMMEDNQVAFTSGTYDCLINACHQSHEARLDSSLPHPGHSTVDTRNLDTAFGLVPEMRRRGLEPDRRIYCSLMKVCLSYGDVPRTRRTFADMTQAGIEPDIYAFNFLMQGCAIERDLDAAMSVLEDMRQARVLPVTITYNTLLNLCAQMPSVDKNAAGGADGLAAAESVLASMERNRVRPDRITYNTLIKACANTAAAEAARDESDRERRQREAALARAVACLESMKVRGIAPDIDTYNSILRVCSHGPHPSRKKLGHDDDDDDDGTDGEEERERNESANKVERTVDEVVRQMESHGVAPDGVTATLLISFYGARDEPAKAFSVLEEMQRRGVKPYLPSYTALITACRHAPDQAAGEAMAFKAFEALRKSGLTPTPATYNALLAATPHRAEETIKMMKKHNIEATPSTWNQLIYSASRRLQTGERNGREMQLLDEAFANARSLRSVAPSSVEYGYLLEACLAAVQRIALVPQQRDGARAKPASPKTSAMLARIARLSDECWDDIKTHRPSLINQETCLARIRLCLRRKKAVDPAGLNGALEAYGLMRQRGFQPSLKTYGALVRACALRGDSERAMKLVEDMRASGLQPGADMLGEMAQELTRSGNSQAALQVLMDLESAAKEQRRRERYQQDIVDYDPHAAHEEHGGRVA